MCRVIDPPGRRVSATRAAALTRVACATVLWCVVVAGGSAEGTAPSQGESPETTRFRFTSDWHSNVIPTWREVLARFVGNPEFRYLEIGIFQGRSFFWVLDNVATHPTSRLTGIDINLSFIGDNLSRSGAEDRIELLEGRSVH